jgi:MFS family permease
LFDDKTGVLNRLPSQRKVGQSPFGAKLLLPLSLGATLNPINSTMLSTAFVPIQMEFKASVAEAGWLIAGLYLTSAIAQPTLGRLADLVGARRVYLVSLLLVALAGLIGAYAPSLPVLIWARVLLGLGTSGAYPSAMRIFRNESDKYGLAPPRTAMGVLSFSAVATTAVGPVIGGVLTAFFGWHSIFTVNVPLALIAFGLVLAWVPPDVGGIGRPGRILAEIDLVGIALFGACLSALMLFLMRSDRSFWPALAISALLGVALVLHSNKRENPFIDVQMLRTNRPLTVTYLRIGLILLIVYCVMFGFAQWLESGAGYSAAQAGLINSPMSIVAAIASFAAARTKGIRAPFILGTASALAGCICLYLMDYQTSPWLISAGVALFGLPMGLTTTTTQAAVYIQAPANAIGTASGLQRTAGYVGAISSTSLLGLLYGSHATDDGLHSLSLVMGALSAVLVVATIFDRTLPETKR